MFLSTQQKLSVNAPTVFIFRTERAMEEFWAYEFLSLRNVRPAVVQIMQDDKVLGPITVFKTQSSF